MTNLWKDLSPGPKVPDVVNALIEIPKNSVNKYEFAKEGAWHVELDRVLYSPVFYVGDYGIIPQTWWHDGDPLDILVMVTEPTFPGCVIKARPVALLKMIDNGDADDKIIAVPMGDPRFADVKEITDISKHLPKEIAHFFEIYKQLEGKKVKIVGWENAEKAKKIVLEGIELYRQKFGAKGK